MRVRQNSRWTGSLRKRGRFTTFFIKERLRFAFCLGNSFGSFSLSNIYIFTPTCFSARENRTRFNFGAFNRIFYLT